MKAIIYKIENLKTRDCYVGSTTNYSRRKKRHFEDLKDNKHHSIILQRAYNKYGKDLFVIHVIDKIEYETKEEILEKEQYYIDTILPKYNVCKTAGSQLGAKRSEEFKKQCSDRMKGNIPWNKGKKIGKQSTTTIKKRSNSLKSHNVSKKTRDKIKSKLSKPVLQYDKDGIFIREWDSAKQASIELDFSYTALIKYLNGKSNINTFKNWIWKRK